MNIQPDTMILGGVLLLSLITVESGGLFLRRIAQGDTPFNELQRSFFRAGHAHAGVLLILGLLVPIYLDAAETSGVMDAVARYATPVAAILLPAGFFLSVIGRNPAKPNRFVVLLSLGGGILAVGLLVAGVALIMKASGFNV